MAIKKVYYNGNSKIISALCAAINDLIDSGGGGAQDVAITKDNQGNVATTLTKADNGITFINDDLVLSDTLTMDRGDGTDSVVIDRNYTNLTDHSTDIYDEFGNVLLHHEYYNQGSDEWEKTILYAMDADGGISKIIFKIGTHEVSVPHDVDGVIALTSDIPTKLSDLTDDVVAGNYLPLAGGTMTGAIKLAATAAAQNTNPSYLLTMDAFASGGEVKYTTASASVVNNSIVKRNASGYIYGAYFNQSSADETSTFTGGNVGYIVFLNGTDNFFRKVRIADFYETMHKAYFRNGTAAYNFGYTTGNVGSLGGQLISYNSNASGYTRMYASAFNSPSCKFLKENVRDITIEDARKVFDLRPVFFDYKEPYGEKGQQGLIAEEAYKVLPSVVDKGENWDISEDADEYNQEQIEEHFMDVSGEIPSIEYSKIVPYLIKIVQDQEQRICDLEKRIADLEGVKVSVGKEQ